MDMGQAERYSGAGMNNDIEDVFGNRFEPIEKWPLTVRGACSKFVICLKSQTAGAANHNTSG